jgi:hypothetical protein
MHCWKCGAVLSDPAQGKLPFRATCDKCFAWLHCCRNCKHYKPGMPNDCRVPGTEYIADREAFNFCEEYHLLGLSPPKKTDPKSISKKLFGEEQQEAKEDTDPEKKFKNLFEG